MFCNKFQVKIAIDQRDARTDRSPITLVMRVGALFLYVTSRRTRTLQVLAALSNGMFDELVWPRVCLIGVSTVTHSVK